jgi:hypothetical protein
MVLPEPQGWEEIARRVARSVEAQLGDLSFVIEPWVAGTGAPAPSERYDENALMATGALVVNAARAGLALWAGDSDSELGGPFQTSAQLTPHLSRVLGQSVLDVPARCRRLLLLTQGQVGETSVASGEQAASTIEHVVRATVQVLCSREEPAGF